MSLKTETETTVIRVTKEGVRLYDKLRLKFGGKFRRPAFIEELCRVYEETKKK